MNNLINFLIRNLSWFLFAFYVVLSCVLLFSENLYQQSVYLTSAGGLSNSVYSTFNSITAYFNLRDINNDLQHRNAMLENRVLNLQQEIINLRSDVSDSTVLGNIQCSRFDYVIAGVMNNSVSHPKNFFTINKGKNDGIKPGMGVVDQNGIVGIVNIVGDHVSRVRSVLNVSQPFSVKVMGTNFAGSLIWHVGSPKIAYVQEMPRHVKYQIGDTIVTSGYSTTFPENIPVGRILAKIKTSDDNFYTLKIELASDFEKLSTVRVIKDAYKTELDTLQKYDNSVEKNN